MRSPLLTAATLKAETAYPTIPPLNRAIQKFQTDSDWRSKCYQSLSIDRQASIVDGIDLLARDLGLDLTIRMFSEMS